MLSKKKLLYELYLLALSPSFPLVSKYLYTAIKTGSPLLHAQYILGRHAPSLCCRSDDRLICISGKFLTRALRYPICTLPVLDGISRLIANMSFSSRVPEANGKDTIELPKRLFRLLDHSMAGTYGPKSDPLPMLQFLWQAGIPSSTSSPAPATSTIPFMKPSANSHCGYPLFRAVYAHFSDLIQFLLDRGADPKLQSYAAVKAAILAKDVATVKMLVECEPEHRTGSSKKRKRSDRVIIDSSLLDLAIKNDAREIVEYFMMEKGIVPDMKTLRSL